MKLLQVPKRHLLVLGTLLRSVLLYVHQACTSSAKDPIKETLGFSNKQTG